ncbi:MAG: hypothetical protein Q9209_003143 [Squamulea sp. 1 TL-2023]
MPEILYVYMSPKARDDFYHNSHPKEAPPKYDAQGNTIFERWPEPGEPPRLLLDYPHLPDQVGTQESWWVFETWRRLDPRIMWKDIHMRQYGPNRTRTDNTVQKLVQRARVRNYMIAWDVGQNPAPVDAEGYPLPTPTNKVAALMSERKKHLEKYLETAYLKIRDIGALGGVGQRQDGESLEGGEGVALVAVAGAVPGAIKGLHLGADQANNQDDTEDAEDQPADFSSSGETTLSSPKEESRIAYDYRGAEAEVADPLSEGAVYSRAAEPGKRRKLMPATERGIRSGQRSASGHRSLTTFESINTSRLPMEENYQTPHGTQHSRFMNTQPSLDTRQVHGNAQTTLEKEILATMEGNFYDIESAPTVRLPRSPTQTPAIFGTYSNIPQPIHTDVPDSLTRTIGPFQMPPQSPLHASNQPSNPPRSTDPARLQNPLLQRVARVLWLQQQQDPPNHPPPYGFGASNPMHQTALAEDELRLPRGRNNPPRTYSNPSRRPRYDEDFAWSNQDQEEARRKREERE